MDQKYLNNLKNTFRYKYRIQEEDAWDCVTIALEKRGFVGGPIHRKILYNAYVDHLRLKFGRLPKVQSGKKGAKARAKQAEHNHVGIDTILDDRFLPDRHLESVMRFVRLNGSRNMIGCTDYYYDFNARKVKRRSKCMSIRRIVIRYMMGWTMLEIGRDVGVTESRICQIIAIESKRLYKLINSH